MIQRSGGGALVRAFSTFQAYAQAIVGWIRPPIPEAIADSLQLMQFQNIRSQVPILLSVAGLNVGIIMVACAHGGFPFHTYGWLSLLIIYCLLRLLAWTRIFRDEVKVHDIPRIVRFNIRATFLMMIFLGIDAALIIALGMFDSTLLVPISLALGSMAIAHCFYALRPAAIGTLVFGMMPSALAMIATGNFEAKMIGISMISVSLLMIRFVAEQYNQLIARLHLEKDNHALANTDPLTGLANRRAVMARLALLEQNDAPFGVALFDLNGFKQVNDSFGHHIGDALLVEVAARLQKTAEAGDMVGRLGGDEFIALFEKVDNPPELSARGTALLASLVLPLALDGIRIPVSASMGSALFGADGRNADALLKEADARLYAAKREKSVCTTKQKAA